MIAAAIAWIVQDMLQVLAMGIMLVPELFLLVLEYTLLASASTAKRVSILMWYSFAGGLLWDLRWAVTPGMSAVINVIGVSLAYWLWDRTPIAGRSALMCAGILGATHFASGIAHYLAWAVPSQAAVRMFLIQQLTAIPVLAILCGIYAFKAAKLRV